MASRLERWVMTTIVLSLPNSVSDLITCCSVWLSIMLVGSSSTSIGGVPTAARAIVIAWRCPPDRPSPFSPSGMS